MSDTTESPAAAAAPTHAVDYHRVSLFAKSAGGAGLRLGLSVRTALENARHWQGWIEAAPSLTERAARRALAENLLCEVQTTYFAEQDTAALSEASAWAVVPVAELAD